MRGETKDILILIIEDSLDDAELLLRVLKKNGYAERAEVTTDFASAREALSRQAWDIVLSDYNLPNTHFSDILHLVKAKDPDLPVIVVSGAVGEEVAVSLMRDGASDLILKDKMARLVPAIDRELKAAAQNRARRESDRRFRDIVFASADWVWETDSNHRLCLDIPGRYQAEWAAPLRSLGRTHCEAIGADVEQDNNWRQHARKMDNHEPFHDFRFCFRSPNGQEYHVSMNGIPVFGRDGEFVGYRGTATDETLIVETYLRAEMAEEALRDAIEALPQGFVIADKYNHIVGVNDAYRRLYPQLSFLLQAGTPWATIQQKMTQLELVSQGTPPPEADERTHRNFLQILANGKRILVSEAPILGGGWVQMQADITNLSTSETTLTI